MAYISKSEVQEKRKQINALCKKHNVTATVSGANTSSVIVTIRKGKIDFLGNHVNTKINLNNQTAPLAYTRQRNGYMESNPYYLSDQFSGVALEFLESILSILKQGYYDNSDIMTDYFDTAWYIHICIGTWNKPYLLITE